jgi:hypothetical protein
MILLLGLPKKKKKKNAGVNSNQSNASRVLNTTYTDEMSLTDLFREGLVSFKQGVVIFVNNSNKSINIQGSTLSNNQFVTGDQNTTVGNWGPNEEQKFQDLLREIRTSDKVDPKDAEDAIEALTDLKEKHRSGTLRRSFLEKIWSTLPDAIRLMSGAIELFHVLSSTALN